MKKLRADQTWLAKAVTIVSVVLTVALGLCGANFAAVLLFAGDFITEDPTHKPKLVTRILVVTGVTEICVISAALAALVVLGVLGPMRAFLRGRARK